MWRTEAEAKAAHCPVFLAAYKANANMEIEVATRCIGAKCMAWRQKLIPDDDARQMKGYCGLAGAPPQE